MFCIQPFMVEVTDFLSSSHCNLCRNKDFVCTSAQQTFRTQAFGLLRLKRVVFLNLI